MPSTTASATFRVVSPTASIGNVSVSGSGANTSFVIKGSGFGPAPKAMPFTGNLDQFSLYDNFNFWGAGHTGDAVTVKFQSWTDTQIVTSGFGGSYGQGNYIATSGDNVTIKVTGPAGNTVSWGINLPGAATFTSNTALVLGRSTLTSSMATQLTGVSVPAGSATASSGDQYLSTLAQAQQQAQQASDNYNSPSFVWQYRNYVGQLLYFDTTGLYNPIQHVPSSTPAGWGFKLLYGYVGGQQVPVRDTIITATNITGIPPSGYKMVFTKLSSGSQPDPAFHNLTDFLVSFKIELFAGSQSISGQVTNGFNNGYYSIPAGGKTFSNMSWGLSGFSASGTLSGLGLDFTWQDPVGGKHAYTPNAYALYSAPNGVVFSG